MALTNTSSQGWDGRLPGTETGSSALVVQRARVTKKFLYASPSYAEDVWVILCHSVRPLLLGFVEEQYLGYYLVEFCEDRCFRIYRNLAKGDPPDWCHSETRTTRGIQSSFEAICYTVDQYHQQLIKR